ncbi:MAG: hypothetical protein JRG79_01060 [Deltaproteobacteria bacterium]|nr:hypothetical protein [Deltaproteobacteria bacterium]
MTQITLRGIDPKIDEKIRKKKKKSGKSLNRVVLDIIYKHSGLNKKDKRPPADSLRKLAGGWKEKDASVFLDSIKSCEQIDEDRWK